ncbi:MAG: 50S ribosomal protein L5 [Deltaproteobacteria bacterium]|jgi:large subunit ribosomal protein L5|nr:50S ribosomal protein L5 [Deltaproteobacteria bacterium]
MAKKKGRKKSKKGNKNLQNERVRREAEPRYKNLYKEKIIKNMVDEFAYKNRMEVPKLKKIIVNVGLGEAMENPKILQSALKEITMITGRKPVVTKAKKSIANFKLREGTKIGAMVTLRKEVMYEFFERLKAIAMPRKRDFNGVSVKSFDGRGNYSLSMTEQIIFPEISYDDIEKIKGMSIQIVTSAQTDKEARSLLGYFGMPFRKTGGK